MLCNLANSAATDLLVKAVEFLFQIMVKAAIKVIEESFSVL